MSMRYKSLESRRHGAGLALEGAEPAPPRTDSLPEQHIKAPQEQQQQEPL